MNITIAIEPRSIKGAHPSGILLKRSGYYTVPPLDELTDFVTEDGKCIVPNFMIGRRGYGKVYFVNRCYWPKCGRASSFSSQGSNHLSK